jgi:hypothetical protein
MSLLFPAYTREELEQRARILLRTRTQLRSVDVSHGSDYDITARLLAALTWALGKRGEIALRLLDPRRAFGDVLTRYASEVGLGRTLTETATAATFTRGKVILVSGTANQVQPAGTVLRHADGTEYTLDADTTTSASASKTLYAGHRSSRRRLFQGHVGGGFTEALPGEVYRASATGEVVALKDVDNGSTLQRWLFDLYNALEADPDIHDPFVQQLGAVASVTARVAGAGGNKDEADVLRLVSPAGTVIPEAQILFLDGGNEAMPPAEMQKGLRDFYGERAGTGTLEDLRGLARSYDKLVIDECYVVPAVEGMSSYALLPVSELGRYMGENELAGLRAFVSARCSPVDKILTPTTYEVADTEIDYVNIQCAAIYRPDWSLADQGALGLAIVAAPSVLSLTLADLGEVAIGHRVIVTSRGTSGPYIAQRRVVDVVAETLLLDEPLPFPPDLGASWVTPGGPLGEAVIEAVYTAYEARAPRLSSSGSQIRYPAPEASDGAQDIVRAISEVEGVLDAGFRAGESPAFDELGGITVPQLIIRMYA